MSCTEPVSQLAGQLSKLRSAFLLLRVLAAIEGQRMAFFLSDALVLLSSIPVVFSPSWTMHYMTQQFQREFQGGGGIEVKRNERENEERSGKHCLFLYGILPALQVP